MTTATFSRTPKPVTVHGVTYRSLNAASKALGVDRSTASYRLAQGLSPDEAFRNYQGPPPNLKMQKLRELADKHHLLLGTVIGRVRRGLRGSALTCRPHDPALPRKKNPALAVIVDGRKFDSMKDAAAAFGIAHSTAITRRQRGWSLEETFELAPKALPHAARPRKSAALSV